GRGRPWEWRRGGRKRGCSTRRWAAPGSELPLAVPDSRSLRTPPRGRALPPRWRGRVGIRTWGAYLHYDRSGRTPVSEAAVSLRLSGGWRYDSRQEPVVTFNTAFSGRQH